MVLHIFDKMNRSWSMAAILGEADYRASVGKKVAKRETALG